MELVSQAKLSKRKRKKATQDGNPAQLSLFDQPNSVPKCQTKIDKFASIEIDTRRFLRATSFTVAALLVIVFLFGHPPLFESHWEEAYSITTVVLEKSKDHLHTLPWVIVEGIILYFLEPYIKVMVAPAHKWLKKPPDTK